ncbi:MAG TPA: hypothetical protein VF807_03995 [Ktedonobacterales bacterium]
MAGIAPSHPLEAENSGRPPERVSQLSLSRVRALLWLTTRLRLRRFTRSWQAALGMGLQLVFLLGFAVIAAVVTSLAYLNLDQFHATQVLFLVLVGIALLWVVSPLLQFNLNEGLDVMRLQTYPVSRLEQMIALVLATTLDTSAFLLVGLFIAVLVGWHATPLAIVLTALSLLVAWVLIVATSQLVLAALMGMLRSRRFRDMAIIFFTLFGVTCSVTSQVAGRLASGAATGGNLPSFLNLRLDEYLQWLPTGMAARAITLANEQAYGQSVLWLAGATALVPVVLALWAFALDRGITTADSDAKSRGRTRRRAETQVAPGAVMAPQRSLIPSVSLAVTGKDLRYFWRDPQLKATLLSSILLVVLIAMPQILYGNSGRPGRAGDFLQLGSSLVLGAALPAIFSAVALSQNSLGLERRGVQVLLTLPVRGWKVFVGKNLATLLVAGGELLVIVIGAGVFTHHGEAIPAALGAGAAGILVALGLGNLVSVFAPLPVREMRIGEPKVATESGCLRSLLTTAAYLAVWTAITPVAAALVLPLILDATWLQLILIPIAILYGLGIYAIATMFAGRRFERHAPELATTLIRTA